MAIHRPFVSLERFISAIILTAASIAMLAFAFIPLSADAASNVEVWWPAQNASMEGTQPWKAVLKDITLADYEMFWSVDGGNHNPMYDSQADYPHKEAMVDVTGWKWNENATYTVTFIAKDRSGSELARSAVTIRNSAQQVTTTATPAPAPTPSNVTVPAPVTAETATLGIKVASPTIGAYVNGSQKISASIPNKPLSTYTMYWSVDGGNQNAMHDSYEGGAHKENQIDFANWTWKGSNAYVLDFIAKDSNGRVIARTNVPVYVNAAAATAAPAPVPTPAPAPAPTQDTKTTISTVQPKLYVDPNNPALAQARIWKDSRPTDAAIMEKIGAQPTGIWLGGWNADVQADVSRAVSAAKSQNAAATFIAYNIPGRDCGQYSAGGVEGKDAYIAWIKKIAAGIGSNDAIVVLEPDAIALTDCLSDSQKNDRYSMISQAVDILSANAGTKVYIDAGHSGWVNASDMASRLSKAGVSKAAGFALNTSNYVTTAENVSYGTEVSKQTGGKRFVVDTSRNGSGSNGQWCNPDGRSLGQAPTLSTGNPLVDAYLWAKKPGESDGNCNGGPNAGEWWPEYALGLAKRAGY